MNGAQKQDKTDYSSHINDGKGLLPVERLKDNGASSGIKHGQDHKSFLEHE